MFRRCSVLGWCVLLRACLRVCAAELALMIRLGSLIPKHQGRVRKDKEAAAGSGGSQQSAGGSEKKDHSKSKGGKKKR